MSLSLPIPSLAVRVAALALVAFATGCSTPAKWNTPGKKSSVASSIFGGFSKKGGGYYLDDGPGDDPPPDLQAIPDAVPRHEPLRPANMRPYAALGKWYTPKTSHESYRERGMASWYGRRYHGQRTATGEIYDMYGMTAAHTTLPLPSYVRVTNISNGKSVVLRVNDRGPFLSDRLIDLSYTAAYKLDVLDTGSALVEVESILPGAFPVTQVAVAPVSGAMQFPDRENANPRPLADAERPLERPLERLPLGRPPLERPLEAARPDLFEVLDAPKESISVKDTPRVIAASQAAPVGGIYLQLGAFSAYDNADSFLARMRAELPVLPGNLGIVAVDGLYKVHAGPYPDHIVARQAADKIAQSLSIKPMLLKR